MANITTEVLYISNNWNSMCLPLHLPGFWCGWYFGCKGIGTI